MSCFNIDESYAKLSKTCEHFLFCGTCFYEFAFHVDDAKEFIRVLVPDAAPRTGLQPESRISTMSSLPGITSWASFMSWTASWMASSVNTPLVVLKGTNAPILTVEGRKFVILLVLSDVENEKQQPGLMVMVMMLRT